MKYEGFTNYENVDIFGTDIIVVYDGNNSN